MFSNSSYEDFSVFCLVELAIVVKKCMFQVLQRYLFGWRKSPSLSMKIPSKFRKCVEPIFL